MSQNAVLVVAAVAVVVYFAMRKPDAASGNGPDWSSATVLDKPPGWWDDACSFFVCDR